MPCAAANIRRGPAPGWMFFPSLVPVSSLLFQPVTMAPGIPFAAMHTISSVNPLFRKRVYCSAYDYTLYSTEKQVSPPPYPLIFVDNFSIFCRFSPGHENTPGGRLRRGLLSFWILGLRGDHSSSRAMARRYFSSRRRAHSSTTSSRLVSLLCRRSASFTARAMALGFSAATYAI